MQQNIGVIKTPGTQGESDFQQDPKHKANIQERLQTTTIMSLSGQEFRDQLHHLGAVTTYPSLD